MPATDVTLDISADHVQADPGKCRRRNVLFVVMVGEVEPEGGNRL
jgi:hypothetical protein